MKRIETLRVNFILPILRRGPLIMRFPTHLAKDGTKTGRVGAPCHADVLLAVANDEGQSLKLLADHQYHDGSHTRRALSPDSVGDAR